MRLFILLALLLVCTATLRADPPTSAPATQPISLPTTTVLNDQKDRPITPLRLRSGRRAVVLIFIATDCPISNGYAPAIADLYRAFTPQGIDFYTVYTDATLTSAAAATHHDAYAFPCDALLDLQHELSHIAGATVTPEAVVVGPVGTLLYRGRIDDQYVSVGHKRFAATTHELKDVLAQITADRPVSVAATQAVGCSIP